MPKTITLDDFVKKYLDKTVDLLSTITRSWKPFMALFKRGIFYMYKCMFCTRCNLQIFNSVIKMVSVYMMNNFFRLKLSTKMQLHNFSMATKLPVRVVSGVFSLKYCLTLRRAKNTLALFMAFIVSECFIALIALKNSAPEFIITISVTKTSFLARWSLKWFGTLLTKIQHKSTIAHNVSSIYL